MIQPIQTDKNSRLVEASCQVCGARYTTIVSHDPGHCPNDECAKSLKKRKAARGGTV